LADDRIAAMANGVAAVRVIGCRSFLGLAFVLHAACNRRRCGIVVLRRVFMAVVAVRDCVSVGADGRSDNERKCQRG